MKRSFSIAPAQIEAGIIIFSFMPVALFMVLLVSWKDVGESGPVSRIRIDNLPASQANPSYVLPKDFSSEDESDEEISLSSPSQTGSVLLRQEEAGKSSLEDSALSLSEPVSETMPSEQSSISASGVDSMQPKAPVLKVQGVAEIQLPTLNIERPPEPSSNERGSDSEDAREALRDIRPR